LPLNLDGYEVFTTASIGIALSTTDYNQPEDLLRNADTAMYQAKTLGKARHEVFNQDMHAMAVTRLQLENNMRRAVERQEFQLHYQPIVSLKTASLAGLRRWCWQHLLWPYFPSGVYPCGGGDRTDYPDWLVGAEEACRQMRVWHLLLSSP